MFSKVYNATAILAIAVLFAGGGLAGYLAATGRVDAEQLERIAAILRGEDTGDEATAEAKPEDQDAAPSAQAGTAEELRRKQEAEQRRRASLERASRSLAQQRELLEQVLADQITRREQFDEHVAEWTKRKEQQLDEARDEGFQRELDYFSKLPPRQAKEVLMRKWKKSPADAVRMLNAVKTSVGQAVLEQLKTPEEMDFMYELLEQLGQQDIDRFLPGSRTTRNDSNP